MKTLVTLDIPESKLLPESLLGCSRHAIAVATERVRGLLGHPSEILAHLDAERGLAPDLIVVSTDPAPQAEADMRCWGLGWRVGRNLNTSWVDVAIEEGRVASATWCQVGSDGVRVTRCFDKDEPTSPQLPLSHFLTASSTEVFVVRRNGTRIPRLRDQELPTTDRLIRLWHGSPVLTEQHFATVAEALAAFDVASILLGSVKAEDALALRCRPHRHALEGWLGLPLDIALRIPAFAWRIQLWFAARGLDPLTEGDLPWLGRIVERAWLPWVAATRAGGSTLPEYGYHSLAHLLEVAHLGAWLALRENVNPIPVALFGLLHDAARTDDEPGPAHAEAAAVLFDQMRMSDIRYLLLPRDAERLRVAIAGHAHGERSQDPLVGVCWDADRVRLAWERGVAPRFFSTCSGLQLARAGPNREV